MKSQRYAVAIVDPRRGVRAMVSMRAVFVALVAMISVPVLLALSVAWTVRSDVQGLYARNRALEIEAGNYRAAVEALSGQIESLQATIPDLGARSSESVRVERTGGVPVALSGPEASVTRVAFPEPAEPASPAPVEAPPAALAEGHRVDAGSAGSAERGALVEALARAGRSRALAESADAPALARQSYQAGVAIDLEARQQSAAGRMAEAMVSAVAADAKFRAAEIDARAEAAARERVRLASTPSSVRPTVGEARDASAHSTDSLRGESPRPALARESVAVAPDVEQAIRSVIAQYVSGLESRDLTALKHVWPSLGGQQERALRKEFENARTVQALFDDPRITVNDDTTTVTGVRTYRLETQDGQRLSTVTRTTITLRRSGNAWMIERVVHR